MRWVLVLTIVAATAVSDLLQSREMKRHGEILDFRPGPLGRAAASVFRRRYLLLAILAMAVSFFSFLKLLSIADLSFAVPATALSYVVETFLAQWLLKERVGFARWTGACLVACGVALLAL